MRGKAERLELFGQEIRITPAYAGKSQGECSHAPAQTDHPRICGEKCLNFWPVPQAVGSPPHMRGKACVRSYQKGIRRITPAYAGKSLEHAAFTLDTKDHPRICGEKIKFQRPNSNLQGSPPHMRGKAPAAILDIMHEGITPAYAGKSNVSAYFIRMHRDHPRICGEKVLNCSGSPFI